MGRGAGLSPGERHAARRQAWIKAVPMVAQAGGTALALTGVYLLWGFAVTLIVSGITSVIIGTLHELAGLAARKDGGRR